MARQSLRVSNGLCSSHFTFALDHLQQIDEPLMISRCGSRMARVGAQETNTATLNLGVGTMILEVGNCVSTGVERVVCVLKGM